MRQIGESELEVLRIALETGLAVPCLREWVEELKAGTLELTELVGELGPRTAEELQRRICDTVETLTRLDRERRRAAVMLRSKTPLQPEIRAVLESEARRRLDESLALVRGLGLHRSQIKRLADRIAALIGRVMEAERALDQCREVSGASPEELFQRVARGESTPGGLVIARRAERAVATLRDVQKQSGLEINELRKLGGVLLWSTRQLRRATGMLARTDHRGRQPPV